LQTKVRELPEFLQRFVERYVSEARA